MIDNNCWSPNARKIFKSYLEVDIHCLFDRIAS